MQPAQAEVLKDRIREVVSHMDLLDKKMQFLSFLESTSWAWTPDPHAHFRNAVVYLLPNDSPFQVDEENITFFLIAADLDLKAFCAVIQGVRQKVLQEDDNAGDQAVAPNHQDPSHPILSRIPGGEITVLQQSNSVDGSSVTNPSHDGTGSAETDNVGYRISGGTSAGGSNPQNN